MTNYSDSDYCMLWADHKWFTRLFEYHIKRLCRCKEPYPIQTRTHLNEIVTWCKECALQMGLTR